MHMDLVSIPSQVYDGSAGQSVTRLLHKVGRLGQGPNVHRPDDGTITDSLQ